MANHSYSKHTQGNGIESTVNRKKCSLKGVLFHLLKWTTRTCECVIRRSNSMEEDSVRGGHFSVVAWRNGKPEKFVIGLRYLSHPKFLELLDEAEREFGFNQMGVLVVPCEASELRSILSWKKT